MLIHCASVSQYDGAGQRACVFRRCTLNCVFPPHMFCTPTSITICVLGQAGCVSSYGRVVPQAEAAMPSATCISSCKLKPNHRLAHQCQLAHLRRSCRQCQDGRESECGADQAGTDVPSRSAIGIRPACSHDPVRQSRERIFRLGYGQRGHRADDWQGSRTPSPAVWWTW